MDLYKLIVKISSDTSELDKGLTDAKNKVSGFGDVFKGTLASQAVTKAFDAIENGVKRGAEGFVNLTRSIVSGYGEAEQLVGGVKKLYGTANMSLEEYAASQGQTVEQAKGKYKELTQAQNEVLENAKKAFKTAGMDANTYMNTATQFSASLISSLGGDTKKAADLTDVAMRSISDNVDTFGSNMEDVTNAFKGFSKQNYTMLDNLKLGYGGTKQEMQRLVKDAASYKKEQKSLNETVDEGSLSFDNIVKAIDVVQAHQGIAGTTAKEAASTLQGSIRMTQNAWKNLVNGLADPDADIGSLVKDMVDSAEGALKNLIPVIQRALDGIGKFVTDVAPIITKKLPGLINQILPPLLESLGALFKAVLSALPGILQSITQAIPGLIKTITDAIPETLPALVEAIGVLIDGIASALPVLIDAILKALPSIAKSIMDGFVKAFSNASPAGKIALIGVTSKLLGDGFLGGVSSISSGLKSIKDISTGINGVIDKIKVAHHVTEMMGSAFSLTGSGMLAAIGPVILAIAGIVAAIVAVILIIKNWDKISKALKETWEGIKDFFASLGDFFKTLFEGIVDLYINYWKTIFDVAKTVVEALGNFFSAIPEKIGELASAIGDFLASLPGKIMDFINQLPYYLGYAIGYIVGTLANIASTVFDWITTTIPQFVENTISFIRELPGKLWDLLTMAINNVIAWGKMMINYAIVTGQQFLSNVVSFFSQLPGNIWNWLTTTISNVASWVVNMAQQAVSAGSQFLSNVVSFISQLPGNVWNWLSSTIAQAGAFAANFASTAVQAARGFLTNIISGVSSIPGQMVSIGRNIVNGVWNGINGMFSTFRSNVQHFFKGIVDGVKSALGIHSPSKVFAGIGKNMVAGLDKGWADNIDSTVGSIEDSLSFNAPTITQDYGTGMADAVSSSIVSSGSGVMGAGTAGGTIGEGQNNISLLLAGLQAQITTMSNLLSQYMPELANMRVVMDTGATVGALAPRMDQEFGVLSRRAAR